MDGWIDRVEYDGYGGWNSGWIGGVGLVGGWVGGWIDRVEYDGYGGWNSGWMGG